MGKKGAAAGGGGKGKGKGGGSGGGGGAEDGKLATCNFVKARHILCEKQGKINDAYKELRDGWLDDGSKVPGPKFGEVRRRLPPLVATSSFAPSAALLSRCALREVSPCVAWGPLLTAWCRCWASLLVCDSSVGGCLGDLCSRLAVLGSLRSPLPRLP